MSSICFCKASFSLAASPSCFSALILKAPLFCVSWVKAASLASKFLSNLSLSCFKASCSSVSRTFSSKVLLMSSCSWRSAPRDENCGEDKSTESVSTDRDLSSTASWSLAASAAVSKVLALPSAVSARTCSATTSSRASWNFFSLASSLDCNSSAFWWEADSTSRVNLLSASRSFLTLMSSLRKSSRSLRNLVFSSSSLSSKLFCSCCRLPSNPCSRRSLAAKLSFCSLNIA
mmetsp:Transcript_44950/g.88221  ORF Transcript_44950/g.88221 Transcript_44950/m.88221 type:complete len:232 (+) Transcript_44950:491-1186(+)